MINGLPLKLSGHRLTMTFGTSAPAGSNVRQRSGQRAGAGGPGYPITSTGRDRLAGCQWVAQMNVHKLVKMFQGLPDQNATVVIGEGTKPDLWLIASGVVLRQIAPINDDHAVQGTEAAVEIV